MVCLVSVDDECMCVVIVMYVHHYTYGHDSCCTVSLVSRGQTAFFRFSLGWRKKGSGPVHRPHSS